MLDPKSVKKAANIVKDGLDPNKKSKHYGKTKVVMKVYNPLMRRNVWQEVWVPTENITWKEVFKTGRWIATGKLS